MVAYWQGAGDICAAYGLASAMYQYGDAPGAAAVAACPRPVCRGSQLNGARFSHVARAVRLEAEKRCASGCGVR